MIYCKLYKALLVFLYFICFLAGANAETKNFGKNGEYTASLKVDREDGLYSVGEPCSFTLKITRENCAIANIPFRAEISKDGCAPIQKVSGKTDHLGEAHLSGKLDEAGFVRCTLTLSSGKTVLVAGAAYDPLNIKPALPIPEDFESYWQTQRNLLNSQDANLKITKLKVLPYGKKIPDNIEIFDVQADIIGGKFSAYMALPKGSKDKSLPAIITCHGAGVRGSYTHLPIHWARNGFLAIDFNANGLPNGLPESEYKKLWDGPLHEYYFKGLDIKDTAFFRFLYLRIMRAIDIITSQRQWDGKILISSGRSQGGGQAIVAAGLDKRITFIASHIAALCDLGAISINRANGWPRDHAKLDKNGNYDKNIVENMRYMDAANFAAITNADAFFSIGYADVVCPPTTTYAAYNQIKGKKQMFVTVDMGHAYNRDADLAELAAVKEHVRKMRAKASY